MRLCLLLPLALTAVPLALAAQGHSSRTTLGGYGEVHYTNSNAPGASGRVNLARFVLYVGHSFTDRITLRSEVEVEDAKVAGGESGGEVALEQAYLDYRTGDQFTMRVGLLLLPIGIMNELHEPPSFHGVERPAFDEVIIPSTWRDIGFGVLGAVPGIEGLRYRAFVVNGLLASGFGAEEGIRGGRQEGRDASFANPALTGRLEWAGRGLKLGGSAYYGGTAAGDTTLGRGSFAAPITLLAADARYDIGPLALRAEAATIRVADAAAINAAYGQDVGKRIAGWYAEGAYEFLHHLSPASTQRLHGFLRYERLDPQAAVAAGTTRDDALARRITTVGLTWKPVWNVAFKADYQWRHNRAGRRQDAVAALGIGYQF